MLCYVAANAQSPPPISIQSATGEVLRLKRMHRLSSADDEDLCSNTGLRDAKVVVSASDLTYFAASVSPPPPPTHVPVSLSGTVSIGGTTITLPTAPASWNQADLENATAIGG